MPTVEEAASVHPNTQVNATLVSGERLIGLSQVIEFTRYIRLVLPLDGYVFWVRADLVSASAIFNTSRFNTSGYNVAPEITTPAAILRAHGSLHYATDQLQQPDLTFAKNSVIFTSEVEVEDFNTVSPAVMYLGIFDGIRFSFNSRQNFQKQNAGIYHYRGDAVYSDMETQIIDSISSFDTRNVIVSNSLPLWLGLADVTPYPNLGGLPLPLFPSFLVPANLPPPFAAVHVTPEGTRAIQAIPFIARDGSHYQLAADKVIITLYGTRNFDAMDFIDYVFQYSLVTDLIGIMNMPIVSDAKKPQSELNVIAMKKTIEFEVSYYQSQIRDLARQLILSCVPTFRFS